MNNAQKPVGIFTSIKFSKDFLIDHFDQFKYLAKPLIVPLLVLEVVAFTANSYNTGLDSFGFVISILCLLVSIFYYALFAIGWQRSILFNPTPDVEAKASRPNKSETDYIMMAYAYAGALALAVFMLVLLVKIPVIGIFIPLVGLPFLLLFANRLLIYFPAKAVGADITFRKAYDLGEGVGWRLFFAYILAYIPIGILSALNFLIVELVSGLFADVFNEPLSGHIFQAVLIAPGIVFLGLIFSALIHGIMTRYYMWAVQERTH